MTSYPIIANGSTLDGPTLTATFQNLMAVNLAVGKGVVSGLEITPGGTGEVSVSGGSFLAQVQDSVTNPFDVVIGNSAAGYLWVEAHANPLVAPDTILTNTFADPGSLYVCLGYVTSDGGGVVTCTNVGRQTAGGASFNANVAAAILVAINGMLTAKGGFGQTSKTVAGSNITLTADEAAADEILLTGTPGASRNIIVPVIAGKGFWLINRTDSSQVIKTPSGSGVTVATMKAARVTGDGMNIIRLTADA